MINLLNITSDITGILLKSTLTTTYITFLIILLSTKLYRIYISSLHIRGEEEWSSLSLSSTFTLLSLTPFYIVFVINIKVWSIFCFVLTGKFLFNIGYPLRPWQGLSMSCRTKFFLLGFLVTITIAIAIIVVVINGNQNKKLATFLTF